MILDFGILVFSQVVKIRGFQMKIYEFCPFNNENLVASIKHIEHGNFLDELHITEADKTFTCEEKKYNYKQEDSNLIKYHQMNASDFFKKNGYGLTRTPWFIRYKNNAWYNESVQRDLASSWVRPNDDDIVILSDIDEIIDSSRIDEIINQVAKHQIITIKIQFTLFYFNLFSKNWTGPPDYSYRVFIMTGKYFNSMKISSDKLRKLGEHGALINEVHCLDGFSGFHHSWLGDHNFIAKKIMSYSHGPEDHDSRLFNSLGEVDIDYVEYCLRNCESIFGKEHSLYQDNKIQLLKSVNSIRDKHPQYFLD